MAPISRLAIRRGRHQLGRLHNRHMLIVSQVTPNQLDRYVPRTGNSSTSRGGPGGGLFSYNFPIRHNCNGDASSPRGQRFVSSGPYQECTTSRAIRYRDSRGYDTGNSSHTFIRKTLHCFFPHSFKFHRELFLLVHK